MRVHEDTLSAQYFHAKSKFWISITVGSSSHRRELLIHVARNSFADLFIS